MRILVLFLFSILFGILWYSGETYNLFLHISWYDLMMHCFGGFLVGSYSLLFFIFVFSQHHFSDIALVGVAVVSALLISVGWEIGQSYGYISLNREVSLPDVWDTVTDIIMGVMGGTLAGLWVKKMKY